MGFGSGSNRVRDSSWRAFPAQVGAVAMQLAIPVCDICDHLCMTSTEIQHDILHPPHEKITSWLGDTRRSRQDETSRKNDISRPPKACLLIYADEYLQKFPCIQPRRSCCLWMSHTEQCSASAPEASVPLGTARGTKALTMETW